MKSDDKKKLAALFIVITFGLSSFAFVATGFVTSPGANTAEQLDTFVVDRQLSRETESLYIGNGYTILKYYYQGEPAGFVADLAESMATPDGQKQLIIEKIPANETRVVIESGAGRVAVENVDETSLFGPLCQTLVVKPSLCLLRNVTNN